MEKARRPEIRVDGGRRRRRRVRAETPPPGVSFLRAELQSGRVARRLEVFWVFGPTNPISHSGAWRTVSFSHINHSLPSVYMESTLFSGYSSLLRHLSHIYYTLQNDVFQSTSYSSDVLKFIDISSWENRHFFLRE